MTRPVGGGRQASTWPCAAVLVVLLLVVGVVMLGPAPGEAADIVYHYDRLGRLIAVVDPSTDTAVYNYDAVGNLLSITRHTSSSVAVIGFDPPSGPIGATVRIQGTGFSATPAQNTVTFNGVTATVSSASATQLVVTVPSGATTGTIGVTAPAGSATSATSFTVATSSGAPTITSFTPTIGVPATSVSISGTNFDATAANDRLQFNGSAGLVSSATSTALSVAVPNSATSGRLSLVTPGGATQSTDDFFVPPAGAAVADVGHTGRATIGGSGVSVSMTTPSKMALVVFDGTAGQTVAAGFSSVSISKAFATLFRPDAVELAAGEATTTTGAPNTIRTVLPVTGTYTFRFTPNYNFGWQTGSFTLTLSEDLPPVPITVGGVAVTLTITRPGQRTPVTFAGTAGQRLSLAFTSMTANAHVTILKPDGTTFTTAFAFTGFVLDLPDLPVTGTYTIWADPVQAATGSLTLTLSEEITGTITIDGASVPLNLARPGQRARLTFSGTAGQQLGLGLTGNTMNTSHVSILKPDGSGLATVGLGPFDGALIPSPLPATGTYSILVDPYDVFTGNITLTLSEELTGSITIGGTGVPVNITRAGQRARLTFSGTANQRINMALTGSGLQVWVRRPDGVNIGVTGPGTGNFMDPVTLPTTSSTYTLYVDPGGPNTGNVTITLADVPPDPGGTLTINGSAATANITVGGQNATYSFTATSGQAITLRGSNNTVGCVSFSLQFPNMDGSGQWVCSGSMSLSVTAQTGTHILTFDPPGPNTGSVDLSVTSP